jgi:hypothetical protein
VRAVLGFLILIGLVFVVIRDAGHPVYFQALNESTYTRAVGVDQTPRMNHPAYVTETLS